MFSILLRSGLFDSHSITCNWFCSMYFFTILSFGTGALPSWYMKLSPGKWRVIPGQTKSGTTSTYFKNDNTSYNINSTNTFIGNAAQIIKLKCDPLPGFKQEGSFSLMGRLQTYTILNFNVHLTFITTHDHSRIIIHVLCLFNLQQASFVFVWHL